MNQRTEPIGFKRSVEVSDGANGTLPSRAEIVYTCLAEWIALKPSKRLEANQDSLRQAYQFKFWVDPDFEPRLDDVIVFRDEELSNQGFSYTDNTRRRYVLTALEGINGANGNPGQGAE